MKPEQISVWDPFVRVFHWSLVVCFVVSYLTEEEWLPLHVYAGYAVCGLVVLRMLWGVVGTRYARFRDFVYRPAEVKAFVKDTARLKARRYIGHNPAGGAMILLMLFTLVLIGATGVAVYGMEEAAGPLAVLYGSAEVFEDVLEALHEFLANFMVVLIVIHVGGVLFESMIQGENLVRAMITGRKQARNNAIRSQS